MARNKEYNRFDVLDKTVGVFWTQGFKSTSMADIVQATGLNTASMYKDFGDKDTMFEESLDHYRQNILSPRIQILMNNPNLNGVEAFLESIVVGISEDYKGCLMMNHIAQKNSISALAVEKINDFCVELEGLLVVALKNAQINNEIPDSKDPAMLASFVTCFVHGLILYGRHPNKKDQIASIHNFLLQTLSV